MRKSYIEARYPLTVVRNVAITTMGVVLENIRLSELLDRIIKELKEKLPDKITEIAGVLFGLKDYGTYRKRVGMVRGRAQAYNPRIGR